MRRWLGIKKKRSIASSPACNSDGISTYSLFHRLDPQVSLVLPTSLDQVTAAAHRSVPTQLPGEDASEDDVRYFLYQILTHKDNEVVRNSPQWILETCMSWHGGGSRLRSLPLENFQQLCPLSWGHANIKWSVKGSKFKLQEMPPCGTRDLIAQAIRSVVITLRAKENGHRSPGWQISSGMRRSVASRSTDCLATTRSTSSAYPGHTAPSIAATSAHSGRSQFYNLSSHFSPQIRSTPSLQIYQDHSFTQHENRACRVDPVQYSLGLNDRPPLSPDDKYCHQFTPPIAHSHSPIPSPSLFYAHSDSLSSQVSDSTRLSQSTQGSVSTTRTSPPHSEDNESYWSGKLDRSCSISRSISDAQRSLPDTNQGNFQYASIGTPSRYRMKSNTRSFDPQLHMAQLRNPSHVMAAPSQTSFALPCGGSDKYRYRRDSAIPSNMMRQPLRREASLQSSSRPCSTLSGMMGTYPEAPQQEITPPTVTPILHSHITSVRPPKDYRVETFAFDTPEQIDYESRPRLTRSMMVNQGKKLKRGKSDNILYARAKNDDDAKLDEEIVGPHVRHHDPLKSVPRLTMIETIEQHQQLGKQRLEGQRRVEERSAQRLKTVYEAIEDKEIRDGRPHLGLNNVYNGWASYL